jgi:hypothetical protein
MGHESSRQSEGLEQSNFFPEDEEFKAVMEEIREEEKKKGRYVPKNDEGLKLLARLRLDHRNSGKPSVEYHDHFLD